MCIYNIGLHISYDYRIEHMKIFATQKSLKVSDWKFKLKSLRNWDIFHIEIQT